MPGEEVDYSRIDAGIYVNRHDNCSNVRVSADAQERKDLVTRDVWVDLQVIGCSVAIYIYQRKPHRISCKSQLGSFQRTRCVARSLC